MTADETIDILLWSCLLLDCSINFFSETTKYRVSLVFLCESMKKSPAPCLLWQISGDFTIILKIMNVLVMVRDREILSTFFDSIVLSFWPDS